MQGLKLARVEFLKRGLHQTTPPPPPPRVWKNPTLDRNACVFNYIRNGVKSSGVYKIATDYIRIAIMVTATGMEFNI